MKNTITPNLYQDIFNSDSGLKYTLTDKITIEYFFVACTDLIYAIHIFDEDEKYTGHFTEVELTKVITERKPNNHLELFNYLYKLKPITKKDIKKLKKLQKIMLRMYCINRYEAVNSTYYSSATGLIGYDVERGYLMVLSECDESDSLVIANGTSYGIEYELFVDEMLGNIDFDEIRKMYALLKETDFYNLIKLEFEKHFGRRKIENVRDEIDGRDRSVSDLIDSV